MLCVLYATNKNGAFAPFLFVQYLCLDAVVHIKLNWVSRHTQTRYFGHFQLDVRINEIIGEHPALRQECAIFIQGRQRFIQ